MLAIYAGQCVDVNPRVKTARLVETLPAKAGIKARNE
jgi:hypothetical protein